MIRRARLHRHLLSFFLLSTVLYACSSDDGVGAPASTPTGPVLRGRVTAPGGGPLAGVSVAVGGATGTTDAQGIYTVKTVAGESVVRFTKKGYMDGLERMKIGATSSTQLDAILLAAPAPTPIDAAAGGEVTTTRGAKVVVPANALVDKNGAPVTGMVEVSLTPIDPSNLDEVAAAPGDFLATQGGQPTMLESFGMVDITIRKGEEKLQVAGGKAIELRIPAPAGTANPPATMPLWSFDETTGKWVDEGTATYDAATRTYVAQAKHMSVWNCDQPYTSTCVCGTVYDKATNAALTGSRVASTGTSYYGTSEASTDDQGRFCIPVRKESDVNVAAYHKSGGGQARAIKSGSADTSVPAAIGDARCVDIGRFDVEKDVFVLADGSTQSCGSVNGVFASGCAASFGTVLGTCFQPSGACVIKTSSGAGGATIEYANGAKIITSGTEIQYIGASGQTCMTAVFGAPTGDGGFGGTYRLPNGDQYGFSSAADGSSVFTCPNGEKQVITAEQQQAVSACTSADTSGAASGGQACTVEVEGAGGKGSMGSTCTDNAGCDAAQGLTCCPFTSGGTTSRICFSSGQCTAAGGGG